MLKEDLNEACRTFNAILPGYVIKYDIKFVFNDRAFVEFSVNHIYNFGFNIYNILNLNKFELIYLITHNFIDLRLENINMVRNG